MTETVGYGVNYTFCVQTQRTTTLRGTLEGKGIATKIFARDVLLATDESIVEARTKVIVRSALGFANGTLMMPHRPQIFCTIYPKQRANAR